MILSVSEFPNDLIKKYMKEELISQLRETEDQTEEELNEFRTRLEEEKKSLHLEWDQKEAKLRDEMKAKKEKLSEDLLNEFTDIRRKASEKREKSLSDLEDRAKSRITEASRFLIDQIIEG